MFRTALAVAVGSAALGLAVPTHAPPPAAATSAPAPVAGLSVSGTGVGMYPVFDADVERYAVTTTGKTNGIVTVHHGSPADPDGRVWVNGRAVTGPETTVTGLESGDEISVIVHTAGATGTYSLVYLPAGFPTLTTTVSEPGIADGLVGLTLSQWTQPTPDFEAVVDTNGVPAYVHAADDGTLDLKRQPNGNYSVSRTTTTPGRTGSAVVELDSSFNPIASHETVGLVDTDNHDSILWPDGSMILTAYEPNPDTDKIDAVIQELDPDGNVVFEWNSAGLVGESVVPATNPDYAHINSVFVMQDGDILASFRHLSAVLKIARTAHDGFQPGDIVWRLGGRYSDFTFADDPHPGGPCAQHTASELPNGNIVLFDNGSWDARNPGATELCLDANDRTGDTIARTSTRVTEYDLGEVDADPATPETATLVWDYEPGRFGLFAGSSQRLANGNTMVGWAAVRPAVATEVAANGSVVWELQVAAEANEPLYSTYRALKFDAPDTIDPEVEITAPARRAYLEDSEVVVSVGCTDRGGSSLRSCGGTQSSGDLLDTSEPGRHTFEAVAVDGAGNRTTLTRTYRVLPAYRPDAWIRAAGARWNGNNVYGGTDQRIVQQVAKRGGAATSVVRLQNDGLQTERLAVGASAGNRRLSVAYLAGGADVTDRVTGGTYRTAPVAPGDWVDLRVSVTPRAAATPGDVAVLRVWTDSVHEPARRDEVAARIRVTR